MTNTIKEGTAQKESAPAGTKGAIQNKHVDSIATPAPEQEVPAHKIAVPGGAVMLLPEAAAAINRHHTDATAHAQSAIDHARAAGDLLEPRKVVRAVGRAAARGMGGAQ